MRRPLVNMMQSLTRLQGLGQDFRNNQSVIKQIKLEKILQRRMMDLDLVSIMLRQLKVLQFTLSEVDLILVFEIRIILGQGRWMDLVQVHTKFLLALKQRKGRHGLLAEPLSVRLEENSAEFQKTLLLLINIDLFISLKPPTLTRYQLLLKLTSKIFK